ncbi:hypothetical protein ABL840_21920 [Variovorax sp. NFACC27]
MQLVAPQERDVLRSTAPLEEEIMKRATVVKAGVVAAILSSLAVAAPAMAGPFTQCGDHWLFWSGYQLIMEAIFDLCG